MDRGRTLHRYRVERYVPGMTGADLRAELVRITSVVAGVSDEGATVRYLGSTFAPDEESCFLTLESEALSVIEQVCSRAGLTGVRITLVEEFPPTRVPAEGD